MNSLCTAEIKLSRIGHNLRQIRKRAPGRKIMVAVKANAYGHGLVRIAKYLEKQSVDFLAVAFDTEGAALREAGVKSRILVLTAVSDYRNIVRHNLTPTIYSFESLAEVRRLVKKRGRARPLPVHLDIDTGMGRIGISPGDAERAIGLILGDPGLLLEGIYTHLSSSDDAVDGYTAGQLDRFEGILGFLGSKSRRPALVHAANSGGIMHHRRSLFNMVRPGIAVYGCSPINGQPAGLDLRPALSLKTSVFHVKRIRASAGIGYGHTYTARKGQTIATIPVGYGDGYSRLLSNRGRAIVDGRWARVVGRVSMDQTTLDVSGVPRVRIGSEVILIGSRGSRSIGAEEIASLTGTISYEILCGLSPRVRRIYVD